MKNPNLTFKKIAILLSLLLAGVVLPVYAIKVAYKTDYTDFSVYYRAALRMKQAQWDQIYSLKDGASPFRYSPIFLPFFRPFAGLSLPVAQLLWYLIQYACFVGGFYWIYRTLVTLRGKNAAQWITALSFLSVLRFCLDTFTIGQVSSLMFFGFTLALYAWVVRSPIVYSLGLLIPTLFKIGPGFLFGIFTCARLKSKKAGFLAALGVTTACLVSSAWALYYSLSWKSQGQLWKTWIEIVSKDSQYYDASHYGSQSLNSFLLRFMKNGWLTSSQTHTIYLTLAILICVGILGFWLLRRPRSYYGRGLFFSLGIFAYLWLMPETFKYSLTPAAIPIALLLVPAAPKKVAKQDPNRNPDKDSDKDLSRDPSQENPKLSPSQLFTLGFTFLTLSLAGKDVVGDSIFFNFQYWSFPFLATVLLAIQIAGLAWKESVPATGLANFLRSAWAVLSPRKKPLGPWPVLPLSLAQRKLEITLLVPIPLHSSLPLRPSQVIQTLTQLQEILRQEGTCEILLIFYGNLISEFHPLYQAVMNQTRTWKEVRTLIHTDEEGRASALRAGFLASQGRKILIAQVEQPTYPEFFQEALRELDSGVDLVRANRRLAQSRFKIPVLLLPLAYRRHRLGLIFNRWVVHPFLPIRSTDTHCGNYGLSLRLAWNAFALQTSSDFLFDLEIGLTAIGHRYQERDLPVSFELATEKSVRRIALETLTILTGIPSLCWRYYQKHYEPLTQPSGITADDWGLSPAVNQGILELVRLGVIRRVSLMANTTYLEDQLEDLKKLPADLGLHFNLTYGRSLQGEPLLASSPGKLLLLWLNPFYSKARLRSQIRQELIAQLDRLQSLGIQIKYLDGHHHIQIIPGLISCIDDILRQYKITQVRLPCDYSLLATLKAPLVLFSLINQRSFRKAGFQSMECFYPTSRHFENQGRLRARLARAPHAEVIVHPAEKNDFNQLEFPDSYTDGRVTEFQALRMLGAEL